MKTIASRQNPWVKRFRDAARDHAGEIVIEGPKAVGDAMAQGWRPIALAARAAGDLPSAAEGELLVLGSEAFEALSGTRTPQGLMGLFERPSPRDLFADRSRLVVALDAVQDPGNVGTIIRLAAAFDAAGVALLPGCADPLGPKAIRASAGAVLTVPVAPVTAAALLSSGWPLVAAAADGAVEDPPAGGAVLVFGNEGAGVSAGIARAARRIAIPMSPRVESLNVATSAAILLARSYALRTK